MLGYKTNPVFYIMGHRGDNSRVKIGKDESWPSRYVQARCHTPLGIQVHATFSPPNRVGVSGFDSMVRQQFACSKIRTRALEWYLVSPEEAIFKLERLLPTFSVDRNPVPAIMGHHLTYDDWREVRPNYNKYRWRIFIFTEDKTGRLKASYGALFDTAFLYCATYNWRILYLVAGYEAEALSNNHAVQSAWNALIEDDRLGRGANSTEVGWLSDSATLEMVDKFLVDRSLSRFSIDRPKPIDAPARDAALSSKRIEIGRVPPMKWVRQAYLGDLISLQRDIP